MKQIILLLIIISTISCKNNNTDEDKNKFIKGYYRSPENYKNYFCWVPFNRSEDGINYAFYKNEMTFKDYAWLYNLEPV